MLVPHYWRFVNEGDPIAEFPKHLVLHPRCCYFGDQRYACFLLASIVKLQCRYKHAGIHILIKPDASMVFSPGTMDRQGDASRQAHAMNLYEANLEIFLAKRRKWLWRKAIFMVRLIVKLADQQTWLELTKLSKSFTRTIGNTFMSRSQPLLDVNNAQASECQTSRHSKISLFREGARHDSQLYNSQGDGDTIDNIPYVEMASDSFDI